jgi:uncharacterized protein YecE (DUF72 family)
MALRIGIGSWADDDYKGVLYPEGLPAKERLKTYATHFDHTEVNSTFYATPRAAIVTGWMKQTPPGFTFTIKLHKSFSLNPHKTAQEGKLIDWTLGGVAPLLEAKRLAGFLLVLEPGFGPEKHRLEELDLLAAQLQPQPLAVELRHNGWVSDERRAETLKYFRDRKITLVAVDMPQIKGSTIMPAIDEVTNPGLAYLRLHGRNKGWLLAKSASERHDYPYSERELNEIAERVKRLAAQAADVHVIANNHSGDFAPKTALALRKLLGV